MSIELEFVTLDLLKEEFSNDRLYNYFLNSNEIPKELTEKIFPDFILTIPLENFYSTTDAVKFINSSVEGINVKDHTLRYYLTEDDLKPYIGATKNSRHYRLNYLSIYRLYLITLFLSLPGKMTHDLKNILKITSPQATLDKKSKVVVNETLPESTEDSKNTFDKEVFVEMMLKVMARHNSQLESVGKFAEELSNSSQNLWSSYMDFLSIDNEIANADNQKEELQFNVNQKLLDINVLQIELTEIEKANNEEIVDAANKHLEAISDEVEKANNSSFFSRLFGGGKVDLSNVTTPIETETIKKTEKVKESILVKQKELAKLMLSLQAAQQKVAQLKEQKNSKIIELESQSVMVEFKGFLSDTKKENEMLNNQLTQFKSKTESINLENEKLRN